MWVPPWHNMRRKTAGMVVSVILIVLSLLRFSMEGSITTEVWGYLLLTPLPIAIALAPETQSDLESQSGVEEWGDSDLDELPKEAVDPLEVGFDVPVL